MYLRDLERLRLSLKGLSRPFSMRSLAKSSKMSLGFLQQNFIKLNNKKILPKKKKQQNMVASVKQPASIFLNTTMQICEIQEKIHTYGLLLLLSSPETGMTLIAIPGYAGQVDAAYTRGKKYYNKTIAQQTQTRLDKIYYSIQPPNEKQNLLVVYSESFYCFKNLAQTWKCKLAIKCLHN